MHPWALWRLLMIGLVALPFLVEVVVAAFRQRRTDAPTAMSGSEDRTGSAPMSRPSAWRVAGNGRIVEKRAA